MMRLATKLAAGVVLVVALGACAEGPANGNPDAALPTPSVCEKGYTDPVALSAPQTPALIEASGLVASRTSRGVLWAHADSGNEPVLYALAETGELLGELTLDGVDVEDAEDLAAAECPDHNGSCLWLADTGDNDAERETVTLFAVREPTVPNEGWSTPQRAQLVDRLDFTYDDGPRDVEAVVVTSDGAKAVLIEKRDAAAADFYVLDLGQPVSNTRGATQPLVAIHGGAFKAPGLGISKGRMVTGADLHPLGQRLAVRTYTGSFELAFAGVVDEALVDATVTTLAWGPLDEPQGEAIAYAQDGVDFFTLSEDPDGAAPQPLHRYPCKD